MDIKQTIIITLCALVMPQITLAQESTTEPIPSPWKLDGNIGLNLNQASYTNWASGGENSYGLNAMFNYSAGYKQEKHIWDNRIELEYGLSNTATTGTRKTNDKIYLSSIYGYEVSKNLYVSGLFNFLTQFSNGYTYSDNDSKDLVSTLMSPAYLTLGAGLTWTPKSWLTATFTTLTWRDTFVLDELLSSQGTYGVEAGSHSLSELGANLQVEVNKDIMKSVNLYSRLILFSNYLEDFDNVDVNWEVQINFNINKWLSANISTNLAYDDNINITRKDGSVGPALQFKEIFGIGLQLKL